MERRVFLKSACIACAGSFGVMWFLEACTTQKQLVSYQYSQNRITIKRSEFVIIKNEKPIQRKFIVLKPDGLEYPIVIYKLNETDYKAIYLKCTHQGCELTPYETAIVCTCHGAEFNNRGAVTTGPADTDLKLFSITYDIDNLYIQL